MKTYTLPGVSCSMHYKSRQAMHCKAIRGIIHLYQVTVPPGFMIRTFSVEINRKYRYLLRLVTSHIIVCHATLDYYIIKKRILQDFFSSKPTFCHYFFIFVKYAHINRWLLCNLTTHLQLKNPSKPSKHVALERFLQVICIM